MSPPPPPQESTPPPVSSGVKEPLLRLTTGGHRKKVAGVRSWQVMDSTGQVQVVEAGKHAIMRRTGLPARDLRILDPVLSYPSTVLGRERAVVVNLEHIKAIITAHEVMFLNAKDPLGTPFVTKLQGIFRHRDAAKSTQDAGGDGNNAVWANLFMSSSKNPRNDSDIGNFRGKNEKDNNRDEEQRAGENARSLKLLPFEFVALEACLEAACSSLEDEATRLEQEAHPALDRLTSKISTLNLERVRQIKSRLVSITGRVQKVRDELEQLLDDDEDMAEMYLTDKFEFENSSASSVNELDGMDEEVVPPDVNDSTTPAETMGFGRSSGISDILKIDTEQEQPIEEPNLHRIRSHGTRSSTNATSKNLDVEELEMILEAYFVQIEGTLNKLSNLREYVDDTEDYLNIMLDDKQNHLLQMGVMLNTATVVISTFIALSGVFGMNISIELFDEEKAGMPDFLWTVGGGFIGCVFLYVAALAWYKHKRLLV
ncbi:hypothetical protein ACS0TY_034678 [Phlomoides rotata]